jgi:hypothetical protein
VAWWIGILFAVGSLCFAVGAAPGYVDAVGVATDGVTFFVGSLFFTVAAGLQYLEVANAPRSPQSTAATRQRRLLSWKPQRIEWWATLVQLGGTILFNLSTYDAMREDLSATQTNRLVWTEAGQAWWSWRPHDLSWRITALNLAGSIAFGASAVASHVVPASDQPRNVALMNLGTFVGALCFLIGAVLLLPERTHDDARP